MVHEKNVVTKVRTPVSLPKGLNDEIEVLALKLHCPKTTLMRMLISEAMEARRIAAASPPPAVVDVTPATVIAS